MSPQHCCPSYPCPICEAGRPARQIDATRIDALERENERLRQLIRDLIEGETAEEGTPQWYALRNARAALSDEWVALIREARPRVAELQKGQGDD